MTKCDLGILHAGWHPIVRQPRNWKDRRPTLGKPRQRELLGGQLVAVDENQTARVERHRPPPRGANDMVLTDIHDMPRQIAEILDDSAADLARRPGYTRALTSTATELSPVSPAVPLAAFRLFIRRHPFGATLGSVQGAGLHLLDSPAHLVG